ncbi:unnamed protein product [Nesidiocoris tenuis]|uniref:Uncharacterized protein n=1 Tax=Nesidiocoris tenuis TaxID=355587 RepID=A0A6H5HKS1_9HEMI|nr:unnamed protein product [Nesidiocoris tenuis]
MFQRIPRFFREIISAELLQEVFGSSLPNTPAERPSVGLYIHGGTCPILQASRHQWQAGRPTQHSTGTFLAVVCELYCTAFSSTFGTLTDFYSGIISSALSTEPVKCANLALENNFLFSLNYPLLSCGALRIASAHRWDSTSTAGHVRDFRQADNCSKLGDPLNTPPSYTHHDYFRPVSTTVIPSSDIVALFLEEGSPFTVTLPKCTLSLSAIIFSLEFYKVLLTRGDMSLPVFIHSAYKLRAAQRLRKAIE